MECGKPNQCCIPLINNRLIYAPIHASIVCRAFPFVLCLRNTVFPRVACVLCLDKTEIGHMHACYTDKLYLYPIPRWWWWMLLPLPFPA